MSVFQEEKQAKRRRLSAFHRQTAAFLAFLILLSASFIACGDADGQTSDGKGNLMDLGSWGANHSSGDADSHSGALSSGESSSGELPSANSLSIDSLTIAGHSVYFGEDVSPLLAALGQWKSLDSFPIETGSDDVNSAVTSETSEPAVAAPAEKLYRYNGLLLLTYPDGDIDCLASVILESDAATTDEGLRVGMEESEIPALLGEGGKQEGGFYLFRGEKALLQLFVSGEKVNLIRYTGITSSDAETASAPDPSAPLILASGISVEQGDPIPFREYIRILDLTDGLIDLYDESKVTFDTSLADTSTVGSYELTVSVKNSAGESAARLFRVDVLPKNITEEKMRDYAAGILKDRVTEGMTNEEKLQIVFQFITKECGMQYVDTSDKDNPYYVEAYNGFTTLRGDCYTFCSMSQVMLDCLGIDYHVVTRNGARRSSHYWLLADFGDGWYHFDACFHSFKWKKDTFKLTDAEVAEFTTWYNTKAPGWNYYQFDHSLYPPTPVLLGNGSYVSPSYKISYAAGEGGSVSGDAEQEVKHGEFSRFVTAVPADGFAFRRWSDGLSTPTRTDRINGDLSVIAEFVPEPE